MISWYPALWFNKVLPGAMIREMFNLFLGLQSFELVMHLLRTTYFGRWLELYTLLFCFWYLITEYLLNPIWVYFVYFRCLLFYFAYDILNSLKSVIFCSYSFNLIGWFFLSQSMWWYAGYEVKYRDQWAWMLLCI